MSKNNYTKFAFIFLLKDQAWVLLYVALKYYFTLLKILNNEYGFL